MGIIGVEPMISSISDWHFNQAKLNTQLYILYYMV